MSGGDAIIQVRENSPKSDFKIISGTFLLEEGKEQELEQTQISFWRRILYFGITHLDVTFFDTDQVGKQTILLTIQTSIYTILREFFSEKNPLSLVVMIALFSLALLMFFLETFVLIFGVRITAGITSAVKILHRGTQRIAEGDLDTKIIIPSEDELGDLATSFNVMAGAVKKGREEAMERERLERELETARQIQEKLLPHEMPKLPGFEIAGISLPSQQVGGDYFDFLDMGTGQLGIAIADVSGKGIPAALLMANLQASLHAQVIKKGSVADVASRMNSLLVKSTDTHMFATFFYGILDQIKSTFTSTNAGHNPPFLFRVDGKIKRLEAGGLVLGFLPDQNYTQQTVKIKQGEVVILFTDGITEAAGSSSEKISENLFGEERLIKVVRASLTKPAVEIQAAILQAISDHTANVPQFDDITLVIIKRKKQKA
jgi:serine phosphatase RsbU (regulator of sigma subunit)